MRNEAILCLSWEKTEKEQMEGVIALALDMSVNPMALMQPIGKPYWGNAALVLLLWGSDRVRKHIPSLLDWIQDINWPGAMYIMELLFQFPQDVLYPFIEEKRKEAREKNDTIWADNLDSLLDEEWRCIVFIQNHTHPLR